MSRLAATNDCQWERLRLQAARPRITLAQLMLLTTLIAVLAATLKTAALAWFPALIHAGLLVAAGQTCWRYGPGTTVRQASAFVATGLGATLFAGVVVALLSIVLLLAFGFVRGTFEMFSAIDLTAALDAPAARIVMLTAAGTFLFAATAAAVWQLTRGEWAYCARWACPTTILSLQLPGLAIETIRHGELALTPSTLTTLGLWYVMAAGAFVGGCLADMQRWRLRDELNAEYARMRSEAPREVLTREPSQPVAGG